MSDDLADAAGSLFSCVATSKLHGIDPESATSNSTIGHVIRTHIRNKFHQAQLLKDKRAAVPLKYLEGHAMPDHIHLLLSIPPKFSIADAVAVSSGGIATSQDPTSGPGATA